MNDWTTGTTIGAVALVVLAVLALVLAVALVRSRRRLRDELEQARRTTDELARRLDELEPPAPAAQAPQTVAEFVITDVGRTPDPAAAPQRIEGRLFADVVLRETVVKAASWTYGITRALSAENRNRLRFEMRRETRRAGKQRKADVKEALRQYYARERGDVA